MKFAVLATLNRLRQRRSIACFEVAYRDDGSVELVALDLTRRERARGAPIRMTILPTGALLCERTGWERIAA